MRASRLLHILLLLQNRGRLTSSALAKELEVTQRTVLRDVDALSEAGLPIVVHRGQQGGIELGFNYRTRLTGFAAEEIEALAVILSQSTPAVDELGIRTAGARAVAKLVESFTDTIREKIEIARKRFQFEYTHAQETDIRVEALANAIRERKVVYINANSSTQDMIHPVALGWGGDGWSVVDGRNANRPTPLSACGDISISAKRF